MVKIWLLIWTSPYTAKKDWRLKYTIFWLVDSYIISRGITSSDTIVTMHYSFCYIITPLWAIV